MRKDNRTIGYVGIVFAGLWFWINALHVSELSASITSHEFSFILSPGYLCLSPSEEYI